MLFVLAEIQILPLVPATPKLGPVYFPVTHLVPGKFPVLLIVPAILLDLLWRRLRDWQPWTLALISGVLFVAVVFAIEWPFADFLMSKASENRFFGNIYFDYNSRADGYDRMREFFNAASGARLFFGLVRSSIAAFLSTWFGLWFGNWMRGVQR